MILAWGQDAGHTLPSLARKPVRAGLRWPVPARGGCFARPGLGLPARPGCPGGISRPPGGGWDQGVNDRQTPHHGVHEKSGAITTLDGRSGRKAADRRSGHRLTRHCPFAGIRRLASSKPTSSVGAEAEVGVRGGHQSLAVRARALVRV
jgi:hypothetical protein